MYGLTVKGLQRRIVWLAVAIVFATGAAVAITVLVPMQRAMGDAADTHIRHSLDTKRLAVDQYLSHLMDIGRQIVSRTQIRKRLVSYNQGKTTYEDVRAFSDPRLGDALKQAGDALGMVRLDQAHKAVSMVGTPPDERVWADAVRGEKDSFLIGPSDVDGRLVVYAVTAVYDSQGTRHGTDIVMFHLGGLAAILAGIDKGEASSRLSLLLHGPMDTASAFGVFSDDGKMEMMRPPLLWASAEEIRDSLGKVVVVRGSDDVERALSSSLLDTTDWILVEMEAADALYADARQSLNQAMAVIALMIAVGALAVSSLLKSITGQVLVTTKDLQRQVAARKRAQFQILQAKEEAEAANKAKSDFLASMSHELRTPLNAVLGFGQLLQIDPKAPLSPIQQDHVQCILDGGEHLLELVNQILDLAKIEANQAPLILEDVRAQKVTTDCIELTRPLGDMRKITVVNEMDDGAPVMLRTDLLRFKQVLLNLLSNAVKYNIDGGMVSVGGWETDNKFYHIYVKDTGSGIPEKDRPNVFHMFHRLGEDPAIAREGTGIGLAVTKLLVEHMAGRIGFESTVGVGSTFWVELPLTSNKDAVIWEDTLRTGVDPLDLDHKKIVGLMNMVNHHTFDDGELDTVIAELLQHAQQHFAREEAVMKACSYPDIESHMALHKTILKELGALEEEWREARDVSIVSKLQQVLRDLWIGHILQEDVKITDYTQGKTPEVHEALEAIKARSYGEIMGG